MPFLNAPLPTVPFGNVSSLPTYDQGMYNRAPAQSHPMTMYPLPSYRAAVNAFNAPSSVPAPLPHRPSFVFPSLGKIAASAEERRAAELAMRVFERIERKELRKEERTARKTQRKEERAERRARRHHRL
ncbi:hypothetical protein DACRYDRAFT_106755 [Dacryopinax primogenitus]|uniref:Uncharacterized protein n=1 Tax=Dacryopinax primogenitus (strain DJM 731) TaxID=1858805 RepID=M5FXH4_DACPD|nr:uncharacterized protein DACRYDRAFT_106755 [Dacryopinax primogenitus]EJU02691.1 hypothetical protein DACRYDRAFT_106755 [Dacryopinax primogenitus]